MKESIPVTDRKSLLNLLNSVCKRTYRKVRQDLTLEFEQNLLKTYVIEAYPNGKDGEYDEYASFLDESLKHWGAYVQKTDDPISPFSPRVLTTLSLSTQFVIQP